jgi:hypothetical protein
MSVSVTTMVMLIPKSSLCTARTGGPSCSASTARSLTLRSGTRTGSNHIVSSVGWSAGDEQGR